MNIVLDSSVIAKWFFKEAQREDAINLRKQHKNGEIIINAPKLLLFELGNIFLNKKVFAEKFFNESIETLFSININFAEAKETLGSTLNHASKYNISFYDATYVALAKSLKCDFITADKKLVKATKTLKFVKLL